MKDEKKIPEGKRKKDLYTQLAQMTAATNKRKKAEVVTKAKNDEIKMNRNKNNMQKGVSTSTESNINKRPRLPIPDLSVFSPLESRFSPEFQKQFLQQTSMFSAKKIETDNKASTCTRERAKHGN